MILVMSIDYAVRSSIRRPSLLECPVGFRARCWNNWTTHVSKVVLLPMSGLKGDAARFATLGIARSMLEAEEAIFERSAGVRST
jgi:hypothetical protein